MYWSKCQNCYKELNFGGSGEVSVRHTETRLHNFLDLARVFFEEALINHRLLPPSCLALNLRPKKDCLLHQHRPK